MLIKAMKQAKQAVAPGEVPRITGLRLLDCSPIRTMAYCCIPARGSAGVYAVHTPDGSYIGRSGDVRTRWTGHLCSLRAGRHHSVRLQAAFDQHGEQSVRFELLSHDKSTAEESRIGMAYGSRLLNSQPLDPVACAAKMRGDFLGSVPLADLLAEVARRAK